MFTVTFDKLQIDIILFRLPYNQRSINNLINQTFNFIISNAFFVAVFQFVCIQNYSKAIASFFNYIFAGMYGFS